MKRNLQFLIILLFTLIVSEKGFAQQSSTITGKVIDSKTKEPIIGAAVAIKGSPGGTLTDVSGNFTFKSNKKPPFTVLATFVGYKKQEIEVYELETLKISLVESKGFKLDEVVVIGYGTQKRSDITGSVASVPIEIKSQPVSSVERLLQGAIAGVQVTQSTGQPGGGVSVQVRGSGSITAGTQPLYVIDGFPVYNDESLNDAGVTDGPKINPLSSINTSDIESIDVLKDASATAIYGSRGANGVVIINTKKGTGGKSSINYDGYYGVQSVVKTIPLLTAGEWGALRNDALINSGKAPQYSKAQLDSLGQGTDWQSAAFREAAIQSHSISILTGSEKTRLAISGNYFKQDGVIRNTGFERYSGRLNVEHDYSKKLRLSTYITASTSNAQVAPASVVPNLLLMSPAVPIYNPDGSFLIKTPFEGTYSNPINTLLNQVNETRTNRILANVSGEYTILDGLVAKVLVGTDIIDNKQNRYRPSTVYESAGLGGIAQVGSIFTSNWLNENTLSYTKNINNIHNFNAIIGFTQQSSVTQGSVAAAAGFATDAFSFNNLGAGITSQTPSSLSSKWALESFLARVNYGYNDKYLLTLTVRSDGSSRFGSGNKWGTFPSAAFAWNAGEEEFIKNIATITHLKFRLSGGLTGNQQIPTYQSLSQLGFYRYNFGNTNVSGFAPNTIANPNLSWEKTAQYDFGIDLGLFKNRVNIVADIYYKKTTDLLLNVTLPATSGLLNFTTLQAQAYQNIGAVENKGIELAVSSKNLIGKFKWNSNLIFAINRNQVLSLGDGVSQLIPDNSLPSIAAVGQPLGSFIVYQTNGLIPVGTPPAKALTPSQNKAAGGQQYVDQNNDGVITQAGDRIIIANQPSFTAGLTNTFNYKGFDLAVFFQASYGGKIYNQNRATLELGTGYTNATRTLLNRYTETNTKTDVHSAYQDPAATISDRFIEDGSYLRLKNISLGYTLPEKLLSKAKIKTIRFYVSAQNLWTLTNYTGYDPEASSNGQSAINSGVDNGVYPNSKTILGGISLSF
ncbi:TonB-linked outer membrane protein, SusC/RagA family [Pseudarcicella hirudinis]|uniref:TonB-linked outer membrane protein, SusC/RagA family n=2 Tax=Pseudarcicella hirudinis TaxID=1079859 RepID=A0A1I5M1P9_9BACT|nr:TonB-dependent receptor [Pseudarcicella hirudinis]SFP03459.1 TonB-linked outer membrane protein, SusC/RagA family [Pseudarcicella hirudinis]